MWVHLGQFGFLAPLKNMPEGAFATLNCLLDVDVCVLGDGLGRYPGCIVVKALNY